VAGNRRREPRPAPLRPLADTRRLANLFLVGRGRDQPLREGFPVFSSSFVEYCYEAIGLDLSPGASERNSAPEHLWNAGLWWHEALGGLGHPIAGCCVLRDPSATLLDPGELER
jgi:hypothetical protein